MQQKLVQSFLQQKAAAFGNNIGKEPQKPHRKLKNMYIIYLLIILAFCKDILILQKSDSNFLTFPLSKHF